MLGTSQPLNLSSYLLSTSILSHEIRTGANAFLCQGVLDHIHENWDVITKDDCVPVHIALQLMDYSSLGRGNDYQDFQRTNRHLQKALKAIVNGQILLLD